MVIAPLNPKEEVAKLRRNRAEIIRRKLVLKETALYKGSFKLFVQAVWEHVMFPGKRMKWNWHLEVICEMLEAAHAGEAKRIIFNVPPRSSKTTIISICYPVWKWLHDPTHQFLCCAHSSKKARADATKARNIIRHPWFQERWGDLFRFATDQNAKERYETDKGGHRLSYGVTTMLAGENADTILIDDPHDPDTVKGDSDRQTVLDNYDDSISQRLNDPVNGVIIVVMQRLHPKDLCGHIMLNAEKGEWLHFLFPQEFEPDHPNMTAETRRVDPRKKPGELLWAERFPESYLRRRRRTMTAMGYSGQHQQRPTPAGGEVLKKNWWRPWPSTKPLPEMEYILHSWDTAYTEEKLKTNSRSAMTSWGVFWNEHKNRYCLMLLRGFAKHLEYPDLRRIAKKLMTKDRPDACLIEKKASGISLVQDLRRGGIPVVTYTPDKSKLARAYAVQVMLESGMIYYPEGKRWAEEVIDECAAAFPNGAKDYADTCTQAWLRVARMQQFKHPDDKDKGDEEDDARDRVHLKDTGIDDDEGRSAYG